MADATATSDSISVTIDKWYHFRARALGQVGSTFRIRLRYNTEGEDEFDTGDLVTLGTGVWDSVGYCFQSSYTDPDFQIILIADDGQSNHFDNVSFREVLLEGALDFKYDYNEARRNSNWIRLNPQGVITPIVTAADFRVKFRATDYRATGLQLDYINARYKLVDKRGIRGLHNANENIR